MSESNAPTKYEMKSKGSLEANLNSLMDVEFPLLGESPCFLKTLELAKKAARSQANVLIYGESGTGKEVVSHYIHCCSQQRKGPFVAVNCAAIPENLLESEFFGHVKGAFTGAVETKMGLFEEANSGTLFLDEIGELDLSLQSKLLRVLQEKKIRRIGENRMREINSRLIAATNKNLAIQVEKGLFREDLFYRLSVIPIEIPALRERPEDIMLLAEFFLKRFARENLKEGLSFSANARELLLKKIWRGNVRELENTIERAVVLGEDSLIHLSDVSEPQMLLRESNGSKPKPDNEKDFVLHFVKDLPSLDEVIRQYVAFAVAFNLGAKDRTAKALGIDRKTLYKRLEKEAGGSQSSD